MRGGRGNHGCFHLTGHPGFYNRGCEAIIVSTLAMLGEAWPESRRVLFSGDPAGDGAALADSGTEVRNSNPGALNPDRLLRASYRRAPAALGPLLRLVGPALYPVTACLSTGGDNYSLDYGSPLWLVRADRFIMAAGVPLVIWGASIGPFEKDPRTREVMAEHLKRVDLITARESFTVEYLKTLGVTRNVVKVLDPAFALEPEEFAGRESDFLAAGDVLGLNFSPLIVKWREDGSLEALVAEMAGFVEHLIGEGLKVLLVPHVLSRSNPRGDNDLVVLNRVAGALRPQREAGLLEVAGDNLSARQTKWLISRCRFFIGARTHATIAALSSGVPTVTIAYSLKARGINRDLFGSERYLLETADVGRNSLVKMFERLAADESGLCRTLKGLKGGLLAGARKNVEALQALVAGGVSRSR